MDQSRLSRSNASITQRGSLYRSDKKGAESHNSSFRSGGDGMKSVPTTRRVHREEAEQQIQGSKRKSLSPKKDSPRQSQKPAIRSVKPTLSNL